MYRNRTISGSHNSTRDSTVYIGMFDIFLLIYSLVIEVGGHARIFITTYVWNVNNIITLTEPATRVTK